MNKDRLWPLGITLFFVIFGGSMIGFAIWAGMNQRVQLVTDDYYAQELRYQETIDRVERTRANPPSLTMDAARTTLQVQLPAGLDDVQRGRIQFYRPSNADLDFDVPLKPDSMGRQSVALRELLPGLWKVHLEWDAGGRAYGWSENIVVGGGGT